MKTLFKNGMIIDGSGDAPRRGDVLIEDDRILAMTEKPAEPESPWCTPPFYYYRREDLLKIPEALRDGCGTDAPGSLVAWMCRHTVMHSMEMPGKRYDIGTLESYQEIKAHYKGLET